MSSDIAIRVENLGKRYVIGREVPRAATLAGRLRQTLASPFSWLASQMRGPSEEEILWALQDVSFEVKRGEVLGVIGRNGAGKSTLLKILSRITEPTTGHAEIHGRVGSLLEVGTGMHPELTGRENIYLNGTILGMRKAEIDAKFDEIVDFSGIERFLDTPVKRYSSGMRVRLGFAIAAHLEPEILIVDEVLAVGDAEFQKKCLGKMKDVAGHGRTVLFVSHNMTAVKELCSRCCMLKDGAYQAEGEPRDVILQYCSNSVASPSAVPVLWDVGARVTSVSIVTSGLGNVQRFGCPLSITIDTVVERPVSQLRLGLQIRDELGVTLTHMGFFGCEHPEFGLPGRHRLTCTIPSVHLYQGNYSLAFLFSEGNPCQRIQEGVGLCPFSVEMPRRQRPYPWARGLCQYIDDHTWDISS